MTTVKDDAVFGKQSESRTIIAVFKGTYVAVKEKRRKAVELNRDVLLELKQVRTQAPIFQNPVFISYIKERVGPQILYNNFEEFSSCSHHFLLFLIVTCIVTRIPR